MRGLKSYCCGVAESDAPVAPYAGAWIEINGHMKDAGGIAVAPYAGAWIEINHLLGSFLGDGVAPYAGAWIEIVWNMTRSTSLSLSHPTRVRGLKSGCPNVFALQMYVAPYAGAWIEIFSLPSGLRA